MYSLQNRNWVFALRDSTTPVNASCARCCAAVQRVCDADICSCGVLQHWECAVSHAAGSWQPPCQPATRAFLHAASAVAGLSSVGSYADLTEKQREIWMTGDVFAGIEQPWEYLALKSGFLCVTYTDL
jgi:hypothetical protein